MPRVSLLLLCFVLVGCATAHDRNAVVVKVIDAETGLPIEGAFVRVDPTSPGTQPTTRIAVTTQTSKAGVAELPRDNATDGEAAGATWLFERDGYLRYAVAGEADQPTPAELRDGNRLVAKMYRAPAATIRYELLPDFQGRVTVTWKRTRRDNASRETNIPVTAKGSASLAASPLLLRDYAQPITAAAFCYSNGAVATSQFLSARRDAADGGETGVWQLTGGADLLTADHGELLYFVGRLDEARAELGKLSPTQSAGR